MRLRFALAHFRLPGLSRMLAAILLLAAMSGSASAASYDAGWTFRRPLLVEWPVERYSGDDLAVADFYTAGHHQPKGEDIRITTDDGRDLPFKLLTVGPGDRVRVVFVLARGEKRYWAYFGHPQPPALPKDLDQFPIRSGLLLEMRRWTGAGGDVHNFELMEQAFNQSKDLIGRTMIDRLFTGLNPFGEPQPAVSRMEGSLYVPIDGQYLFAASAQNKAALYVDGKPLILVHNPVGDTRFRATVDLKRGRHDLVFYHLCMGGDSRLVVVWQRPDSARFELIGPESFGMFRKAIPGPLEEKGKTLTADCRIEYLGETFFANHYSHRYRFTAETKAPSGSQLRHEWDFGDGQSATGAMVEHVYLADGAYSVRLTAKLAAAADAQTNRLWVSRDYAQLDRPPTDPLSAHSKLVQSYDPARMPPAWLPWAVFLHQRAEQLDFALAVAGRLSAVKDGFDPGQMLMALEDLRHDLIVRQRPALLVKVLGSIPADSRLQPQAAREHARLLLWQMADFPAAERALEPFVKSNRTDNDLRRIYAQSLVLNRKAEEGRKILDSLPIAGRPDQQAALSGALARTIEFYIKDNDWETAEKTWERWQTQFPADFLEGYSVLLQTRILELEKSPQPAAKLAEAFALAVPQSSYAPQLLDRASKLLAASDPQKSAALRQVLKQKYPEDPLSQDK